jgi:hypothetical protein
MATAMQVHFAGEIWGRQLSARREVIGEVVRVCGPTNAKGPAENAFVLVDLRGISPRARYISWINYYDIEYAGSCQPGCWEVMEPAVTQTYHARWQPFGWGGPLLPSVAYSDNHARPASLRPMGATGRRPRARSKFSRR